MQLYHYLYGYKLDVVTPSFYFHGHNKTIEFWHNCAARSGLKNQEYTWMSLEYKIDNWIQAIATVEPRYKEVGYNKTLL